MWLALLFILIALALDYVAFKQTKGLFISIILIVVAVGCAAIAAPVATYTNPMHYPTQTITTGDMITTIQTYNVTQSPSTQSQSMIVILGESFILIQVGLAILIIGYLFWSDRKKGKERRNS